MGFFDFLFGSKKDETPEKTETVEKPEAPKVEAAAEPKPEKVKETDEEKEARKAAKKEAERQYTQDLVDKAHADVQAKQAQALAADPSLTEPFEGVTCEGWAQAASTMISVQDLEKQTQALAQMGMDRAKYDRVNAEFTARMQRDMTGALATIYGNAFAKAQSVQADGPEPVSFEKYGEIAGAQAAWGETGADVNMKLKEVFDLTALDISNYGSYWMTKFMADYQLAEKHAKLMEK
ncbi:hypothetical protein KKF84_11590, partial [Myxococcota bacterium]|nr:hypothetical protein [Myxococcota bacterium]